MTIINFALTPERAFIGTDSLSFTRGVVIGDDSGRPIHDTKLIALPHARLVLGVLGSVKLRHFLAARSHEFADIDAAIERIPALLRQRQEFSACADGGAHGSGHNCIVAIGWSAQLERVVAAEFRSDWGFCPLAHREGDARIYLNPRIDSSTEPILFPETAERMGQLLQRQVDAVRRQDTAMPVGGFAQFAEITEQGITLTRGGDLGVPAGPVASVFATEWATAVEIAPGAATDVKPDFVANTVQSFNLGALGVTEKTVGNTITYNNTTGGNVSVEVTWSATHTLSVNAAPPTGAVSANGNYLTWTINGSAHGYNDPTGIDAYAIPNSSSSSWRMAGAHTIELAAGDSLSMVTKVLLQGNSNMQGTLQSQNASLRATVVKR